MGFRFQRRIKILPGVTVNLSKSGISTSLGPRGARITVGHGKTRTTVGIPGTGVSYTETHTNTHQATDLDTGGLPYGLIAAIIAGCLLIGLIIST